ncbi:MAG: hypothetical protein LBB78_10190 [Spirochaetaceae bacterium]|jgi:type I restriction enzyme S subunit|nr:hypothetical protein [Spirochaetaceae bacterium]
MKAVIRKRIEAVRRGEVPEGYNAHFGTSPKSWKRFKLNEICEKFTRKNTDNIIKTVFSNSAVDGVVLQSNFFEKSIANDDNTANYFVVENGDFIYNPRISSNAAYGPINSNELNIKGIVSPLYTIFLQKDHKNVMYKD